VYSRTNPANVPGFVFGEWALTTNRQSINQTVAGYMVATRYKNM